MILSEAWAVIGYVPDMVYAWIATTSEKYLQPDNKY